MMGTSYDVYCCDCESRPELGDGGDVRRSQAEAIFELAPLLAQFARASARGHDVLMRVCGVQIPLDWFAEHAAHKLALRSEYGDVETPPQSRLRGPRYQHDCERCVYLGTIVLDDGENDLYFCPPEPGRPGARTSLVARYGDDGPEYASMPPEYGDASPRLAFALRLARARGLVK
jgi:hypothetical protein